jgi:epoxyqueuosine reductase QueG
MHPAPQPSTTASRRPNTALTARELRELALAAGADDVGLVDFSNPALDPDRGDVLAAFAPTRTLVALVVRMHREPIRSPARSIANLEFHATTDRANEVAHALVGELERRGIAALNPSAGFPMEMERFPGKTWIVSHKLVAQAAGLGRIGIHRNLIHPRFGSFVLLATVLVAAPIDEPSAPLDFNPCVSCKLCVAACPVGAISPQGRFDFAACYTHNYREFMGGFGEWVESIAESHGARDYRSRVSEPETASMWQSLAFGPNYKAAYCIAVCPAGDDVMAPFREDRRGFLDDVLKPLVDKVEPIYVAAESDAEKHVLARFPHKLVRRVGTRLRPRDVPSFLRGIPLGFQRSRAKGWSARIGFTFRGASTAQATVVVENGEVRVLDGLDGVLDTHVAADSAAWIGMLRGERKLLWQLLARRIGIRGSVAQLRRFQACFVA